MISAILLAAGESRRMGKPKQLLPLGKTTVLEQAIDNLTSSKVGEVIVVLGYRADEIKKRISGKPVKIVVNPDYHQGMSTSIIAGLQYVGEKAEAIMLALADQPFVNSQTINVLISEFYKCKKGIVVPVYQGKRGHPVIFDMKYKEKLMGLRGDVGARQIIERHSDDVLEVLMESEGVIRDIDTAEDYRVSLR